MGIRVAIASTDNIVVNQHFVHTDRFYIYDVFGDTDNRLVEERRVHPPCSFGEHDDNALETAVKQLADCQYVICNRIGGGAVNMLEKYGIITCEMKDYIEASLSRLWYICNQ